MSRRIFSRLLCCAPVLLFLVPCLAWSQAVGTILGSVADQTGAVIPGAKVTATNTSTQISQTVSANASGEYTLPKLSVGAYTVTATAPGFSDSTTGGLMLDVSQSRSVDFKLAPTGGTQSAVVTAEPPLLNVTDGSLSGLVSEKQIETLPLNGRSIQNLVMLQPGMAPDTGTMGWLSPQWISNGNRGETEVATLDGSDATDAEMGTVQFWNFNLDAIAEFKVQQANYSAEFGQGAGTITQMVSKSGGNRFHGSLFEFIRNGALDAANFFSSTGPAPFQRNEFGGTLGGPILRNKLFFFGEYAGLRQSLGEPTQLIVPTAAQRSGLVSLNGFNYQVPLNATAAQILGKYPTAPDGGSIFFKQLKAPTTVNQYSIRIDYHVSDRDSWMGRASYINNVAREGDPVAAIEQPDFSSMFINDPRNFAITETHIFTPNLINVAIFTLNRQVEGSIPPSQAYTQTDFGDGSLSTWGPDTFITKYVETYYNPTDKVTWVKGRQILNMGVENRYGQDDGFGVTGAGPNGNYQFLPNTPLAQPLTPTGGGPVIAAGSPSPNGLVSMMEGLPAFYSRSTTVPGFGPAGTGPNWGLRVWHLYTYLQDDVRLTSRLTVNAGLRYEYTSVPYEIRNRLGAVEDSGPLYGQFVLNPQPLYTPQKANFAPRIGVAYKLNGKTTLRGGYAIFTNSIPTVYPDQSAVNLPMASLSILSNPTYSLTPLPVNLPSLTTLAGAPIPVNGDTQAIPGNTSVNLSAISAQIGPISGDWPSTHLKNGSTVTGNVTIERELPGDIALQASYVTNNSSNLYNGAYPNGYAGATPSNSPFSQITPGLGEVQLIYNQGLFHYNSLQVQARKISPLHGLSYQASYSFSKNLTDADSIFSASSQNAGISLNDPTCVVCEYSRGAFDVRHRLVANFSYTLPARWGILPERLSSGWQTLGIFNVQSGFPFTIDEAGLGTAAYGYDSFNGVGVRPFFLRKTIRNSGGQPQFFASDVINNSGNYFSSPQVTLASGTIAQIAPGNLGRNTEVGPSWWNFDFSAVKDTKLTETLDFQFRAEMFNIFNHPTFATPTGVIGNPNFGYSTATASAERQIQFGARFVF